MEARTTITSTSTPAIIEYSPDQHRVFLKNEIRDFKEKLDALTQANKRTRHLGMGTIACMLLSGGILPAVGVVFLGYLANEYALPMYWSRREIVAAEYTQKLEKMTAIYAWCCRKGAAVTNDETFLELLETLAPYLRRTTLYPEHMRSPEDNKLLSEKYRKILLETQDLWIPSFKDVKPISAEANTAPVKITTPSKTEAKPTTQETSYFWSLFSRSKVDTEQKADAEKDVVQSAVTAGQSQSADLKSQTSHSVNAVAKQVPINKTVPEKKSTYTQIVPVTKEAVSLFNRVSTGTTRIMYGFITQKAEDDVIKRMKP